MIRFDDILEKISSYQEKDINLLKKAYVFAARAHKGQIRRSGEPYLSHPLEVTNMLAEMKMDKTTLVAALLHDVLEDTDVTVSELKETFGQEVAGLVEGVTKISRVQDASPETRQAETIRKIILAMTDDLRVIFIKLADRIHNLKTLKFLKEDKQKQIAKETLEIYAPIANRLGMGRIRAELEDLSFRYVWPEDFFRIVGLVEPKKKSSEKDLAKIQRSLETLMKENSVQADIFSRIKRPYSIFSKMRRQSIDFSQVYDFLALRLITDSVKNCYAALGLIHQKWTPLPQRFRDFIAMPKANLYQALHTTIITEDKRTFEVQIRTKEMHDLAENGIAAHWRYKETDPQSLMKEDKRLHWLREMVSLYKEQKSSREFLKNLKTNLIPEEVFVFTPKGRVVNLPQGASALDFAFKIHTEIGLHATAAKINGRQGSLKATLKTGDIVEILTSPESEPRRDWLNIISTSGARHHLKRWLNLKDRARSISVGKRLWEKEARKYDLPEEWLEKESFLKRVSESLGSRLKTIEDFYSLAGLGKIVINRKFIERLLPSEKVEEKRESFLGKVVTMVTKKAGGSLEILDRDGHRISLARCCSPIKGEPTIGYLTSGKGITIHSQRCPLVVKERLDNQRILEVSWENYPAGNFRGKLCILSIDSPGILAKVAQAIAEADGNITKAEVNTFPEKKAEIRLSIVINDIKHLEQITKKLTLIKGVFSVERV